MFRWFVLLTGQSLGPRFSRLERDGLMRVIEEGRPGAAGQEGNSAGAIGRAMSQAAFRLGEGSGVRLLRASLRAALVSRSRRVIDS